ncbi:unnamed protein product [Caenorhabditis bovis]|uniref:DNA polymerase epsilon subunit 3 n=1 Tax=Caenorhabditis bovis TaxID=2654633 RepID=A0A8S1EM47_9PELO|nr:unnamed protein product [Caenorhabditis bovis]
MDDRVNAMSMPQAVVTRILKEENINVSKESRETISRAAAVFLISLSGLAYQSAKDHKHKTIGSDDVLRALKTFENNTMYNQCKQAVDEWKILKQQRNLVRREQDTNQMNEYADTDIVEDTAEEDDFVEESMEENGV